MPNRNELTAGRWFKRVLWIGILANAALAVPTLVAPEAMLRLTSFPAATPLVWPQFAALLLVLLSVFYMPAGFDLDRYWAIAWLAAGARFAGFVFFVGFQASAYHILGYFDLVFFVPEITLLALVKRHQEEGRLASGTSSAADVRR
jgi:hypothetical protein